MPNSSNNISQLREVTWPAMVYRNTNDEILMIIEREVRSRKRPGQIFVPAGKKRPNDGMLATALRESEEETWIPRKFLKSDKFAFKGIVPLRTNDAKLDINVYEYQERLPDKILEQNADFFQKEIIQRTFIKIKEVLDFDTDKIRPWLFEILLVLLGWKLSDEKIFIEDGRYHATDFKRIQDIKRQIKYLLKDYDPWF